MQQVIQETNKKQPTPTLIEETAGLLTQALHMIDDAYYTDRYNMKKNTRRLKKPLQIIDRILEKTEPYKNHCSPLSAAFMLTLMMKATTRILRKRLRQYQQIITRQLPLSYNMIKKKVELKIIIMNYHQSIHDLYNKAYTYLQKAWSEVGKQTEKSLLYVIFRILKIPEEDYILIFDEMKKKGLVENREIDAIVFNKNKEPITIELKLLGIGNPEIGDEALARKVDLFLIDRLTEMMIKESEKIGVKVIEFRQENPLKEIYNFFISKNVNCSEPEDMTSEELKEKIEQIIGEWQETKEEYKIFKETEGVN